MNLKRMLFFGVLLSGVSGLWGAVTVTGDGTGDVVITVDGGSTTIAAEFTAAANTQTGVIAGDLIIKGEELLTTINENAFAGLTSIGGNLVLCEGGGWFGYGDSQNVNLATVDTNAFPDLETVTGTIYCYQCAITSLIFPALTTVGGGLYAYSNTKLRTLSLPALTSVVGSLLAFLNTALTTLSLPALTSVGGYFSARSNTVLTTLSLPALTTVGGDLYAFSNTALRTLSMPALTSVGGDLYIYNNPALAKIPFNLFDVVAGNVRTGNVPLSLFVNNLPAGADKTTLSTAGDIASATAAAALKRHPQVTVNVPGKPRDLAVHISTNYPVDGETDAAATQKKHGLLGLAVSV